MHLLSTGVMAIVGPDPTTRWMNMSWDPVITNGPGTQLGQRRASSTSVLLPIDMRNAAKPERILLIGGYANDTPTNTCEILELDGANWVWRYIGDPLQPNTLNKGRAHADAVLLANGEVLLIGGGEDGSYGCPIFTPELFNTTTESWTLLSGAKHTHPRMYHSVALLLADGSVWTVGQDGTSTCDQSGWPFGGRSVEIYYPSYYDDEFRPEIDSVTASSRTNPLPRGQTFDVGYSTFDGRGFGYVAIIGLSSVTHSVNMSQRYVILESIPNPLDPDHLRIVTPPSADYAPPGAYMLVMVDSAGVPSIAEFVYLSF